MLIQNYLIETQAFLDLVTNVENKNYPIQNTVGDDLHHLFLFAIYSNELYLSLCRVIYEHRLLFCYLEKPEDLKPTQAQIHPLDQKSHGSLEPSLEILKISVMKIDKDIFFS